MVSIERYRNLVETISDRLWEMDKDMIYVFSSPQVKKILGYDPDEVIGKRLFDFMPEEEVRQARKRYSKLFEQQKPFSAIENVCLHKSGKEVIIESSGIPLFSTNGVFKGFRGIDRDITKRKQAENNLRRNNRIQKLINSVLEVSLEQISFTEQLARILEITLSLSIPHLLPKGIIFLVEDDPEILVMKVQRGLSKQQESVCQRIPFGTCICGKASSLKKIIRIDCGSDMHEISLAGVEPHGHYCVPIISGDTVLGVLNIYLGTEHVRSEEEDDFFIAIASAMAGIIERNKAENDRDKFRSHLAYSQKMESVGRLAGGIAHDFNNILTAIAGYAQLTMMEMSDSDPLKTNLEIIYDSGKEAAELVRQLLTFSSELKASPQIIDLNSYFRGKEKYISALVGNKVEVEFDLQDELWKVNMDYAQLDLVVNNIVSNAVEAMGADGNITIKTMNVVLGYEFAKFHHGVTAGEYVIFAITDTGPGMAKEVRDYVFEPFFTTKRNKGHGLGLATVYGVIKQSKGNITVDSEPGQGATFKVYLPRSSDDTKKKGSIFSLDVVGGDEIILLVDDEESVRGYLEKVLTGLGYQVVTCIDGEEALVNAAAHEKIDLLLTDVIMPGLNGTELAPEIRKIFPEVRVLYMSGQAETEVTYEDILRKDVNYLSKPISPQNLALAVRTSLDVAGLRKR